MAAVQNENAMPANVQKTYSAVDAKFAAKVKKAEANFDDLRNFRKSKTSDEQQNVAPTSKRARLWQAAVNVDQSLIWGATTVGLKTQGLAARAVRGPCVASRRGLTASKNLTKAAVAKTKRGVLSAGHNACMATVWVKTSISKAGRGAASCCRKRKPADCLLSKPKPAVDAKLLAIADSSEHAVLAELLAIADSSEHAVLAEAAICLLRKRKPAVDAKLLAIADSSEHAVLAKLLAIADSSENAVLAEAAGCLLRKRKPAVDAKLLAIADSPEKEVSFSAAGLALFGGRSGGPTSVAEAEHAVLAEAASCLFRKRKPAVDAKPLAIADVPESVHGSVAEAVTAVVAESAYLVAKPQEQTAAAVHRASVQNEPETEQADAVVVLPEQSADPVVARMKVQPDRSWIGQKAVEDDALEEAEEEDADSASLSPLMI